MSSPVASSSADTCYAPNLQPFSPATPPSTTIASAGAPNHQPLSPLTLRLQQRRHLDGLARGERSASPSWSPPLRDITAFGSSPSPPAAPTPVTPNRQPLSPPTPPPSSTCFYRDHTVCIPAELIGGGRGPSVLIASLTCVYRSPLGSRSASEVEIRARISRASRLCGIRCV